MIATPITKVVYNQFQTAIESKIKEKPSTQKNVTCRKHRKIIHILLKHAAPSFILVILYIITEL